MVPFDPTALLVMLLAFYPIVGAAALSRARSERPEYFAGGTIAGSKGDKLVLSDGRVFDLIQAAGGPVSGQRWQVVDVTNDPGAAGDPFALVDGPLVPLDPSVFAPPGARTSFQDLVGGQLEPLDGADATLDNTAQAVIEADGTAAIEASSARSLDPAIEAHAATMAAAAADDPSDVVEATGAQDDSIDAHAHPYDEPPPDDVVIDDPGDPPGFKNPGDGESPLPAA